MDRVAGGDRRLGGCRPDQRHRRSDRRRGDYRRDRYADVCQDPDQDGAVRLSEDRRLEPRGPRRCPGGNATRCRAHVDFGYTGLMQDRRSGYQLQGVGVRDDPLVQSA